MAGFKVCGGNYICCMNILMFSGELGLCVLCMAAVGMRVEVDWGKNVVGLVCWWFAVWSIELEKLCGSSNKG